MQNIASSITGCFCVSEKNIKNIYKFHTIQTFIFTKKTKNDFCHESPPLMRLTVITTCWPYTFGGFVVGLLAHGGRWIGFCISRFNIHEGSSNSLLWPRGPTLHSVYCWLLYFSSTGMTRIICLLCCLVLWGYMLVAVSLDTNSCSAVFHSKVIHRIILVFARSRLKGCLVVKLSFCLKSSQKITFQVFYVTQSSFRWRPLVKS